MGNKTGTHVVPRVRRNNFYTLFTAMPLVVSLLIYPGDASWVAGGAAYWIWSGVSVETQHKNSLLYLFQGRFHNVYGKTTYSRLGLYPHKTEASSIYLVYRLESLDLGEAMRNTMLYNANLWEKKGNKVSGIQLDFDAPTGRLAAYSGALEEFRRALPPGYRLSITGLADWVMSSRTDDLRRLVGSADETVFQLYHRSHNIAQEKELIEKLEKADFRFKVGLLSTSDINEPKYEGLLRSRRFDGVVYFVVNKTGRST